MNEEQEGEETLLELPFFEEDVRELELLEEEKLEREAIRKGKLNQEEIDEMVKQAMRVPHSEEKLEKIRAKNNFESFCYQVKNTIYDNLIVEIISVEDKRKITLLIDNAIIWLDDHQDEKKEVYKEKLEELQNVVFPILQTIYSISGGRLSSRFPGIQPEQISSGQELYFGDLDVD